MFAAIRANKGGDADVLAAIAREFSPRVEVVSCPLSVVGLTTDNRQPATIVIDLAGLDRLFGDADTIARELRRTGADQGLDVRVAIAGTRVAARLLVYADVVDRGTNPSEERRQGVPGDWGSPGEPERLAPLPITLLRLVDDTVDFETLRRWGLRTLGELAALPAAALAARLGQDGVRWQRLARGEDPRPLVPAIPEERFEQALDLEWPIEGLEPLSFVLGRLLDPLAAHLEVRGRGAAVLHVRLHLIKGADGTRQVHARSLQLPAAMRDARTLRTLALLDLESHPPAAAIERVVVAVDPTPARVLQFSLLTRPLPSPEQLSTLNARLAALMGEGRCGAPVAVDSWRPGALAMKPFAPSEKSQIPNPESQIPTVALRRFRIPIPARVRTDGGCPYRVTIDRRGFGGGPVQSCAGPWRTSGAWWEDPWDRDEWDVTLGDGATYRIFRERRTDGWFVDGVID